MANERNEPMMERDRLLELYARTRARTEGLAAGLSPEDQQVQSMPEASPTKWHRAHTTWFFEAFVLEPAGIAPIDSRYGQLFNSYYEAQGPRHPRALRGVLSRPSADEIGDYRRRVDDRVSRLLRSAGQAALARMLPVVELGVAHEEQHQELLLTDALHALSCNPLRPALLASSNGASNGAPSSLTRPDDMRFVPIDGGLGAVGAPVASEFAFDNERPRHRRWLEPFALADRLVTFHELRAFIEAGGYHNPLLWLSDGFDFVRSSGITSPLHAAYRDGRFEVFTLAGLRAPNDDEPVAHVSYYEADALARFLGARLPTEAEWERVAASCPVRGNFADEGVLRPMPAKRDGKEPHAIAQLFGDVWQWTSSAYEAYPGYRAPPGALGEYNGKFMVNQVVLRGGSCLSPRRHLRASYRNYWHPRTQFQMAGLRLARGAP